MYVIIVNVPGYLPESDPYAVDDRLSAIASVREEIANIVNDLPRKRVNGHFAGRVERSADGLSAYVDDDSALGLFVEAQYQDGSADEYNESIG
jgi:hypothetical protein